MFSSIHFATKNPNDKTVIDIGDNIFACTAPASKVADCASHGLLQDRDGANVMHYKIKIPKNHPEGLYWYHPHWHGAANSQVGRGLSGLIWIDRPDESDLYERNIAKSRYLMLKDLTVENVKPATAASKATGTISLKSKTPASDPAISNCLNNSWEQNLGYCSSADKANLRLFAVNGQVFPDLQISENGAEIWKIANTSGSMTYQISLRRTDAGPQHGKRIPTQILAKDGVIYGQSCNIAPNDPRCDSVLLMPASRVTLYIARPTAAANEIVHANMITEQVDTNADVWPEVSLMGVTFAALGDYAPPKPYIKVKSRGADDINKSIKEEALSNDDKKSAGRFRELYHGHVHPAVQLSGTPATPVISGECPLGNGDKLSTNQVRLVVLDIANPDFLIGAGVTDKSKITSGAAIPALEIAKITLQPWLAQTGPQVCTHSGSAEIWYIANNISTDNDRQNHLLESYQNLTVL